jgi:hydrocephalus-inducing protein
VSAGTEMAKQKTDEIASGNNNIIPNKSNHSNQTVELDKNPVFDSIARYLGIDLTFEGRAARNRRGVAVIVHGPPLCGKSKVAVALAKHYECAILTVDSIIIDAISTSTSSAASKARQLCAETAAKHAEEIRAIEAIDQQKNATNLNQTNAGNNQAQAGLSVEALAQHSINRNILLNFSFIL